MASASASASALALTLALTWAVSPVNAQTAAAAAAAARPDIAEPLPLTACLSGLEGAAAKAGVPTTRFRQLTDGLQGDASVLKLLDNQPEFRTAVWDYLAGLVDDERVADGQVRLAQWADTLAEVAKRHGVDPATVVAVWGVESNFGQGMGKRPLLVSLGTLACHGRRQGYFRGEFLSLLGLLDRGDVSPAQAYGSWAGAFGQTQFMPSTYERLAVDFDGDGRRDLIGSVPDALASTANFLTRAGWSAAQPWGFEVKLPAGFDASGAGRRNKRALAHWAAQGLRRIDGQAIAGDAPAGLMLPAGPGGPAFLVLRNFDAIYSYNASESYGLAIALLSDRLRGLPALATPWPTDDPGLSRLQRREVQTLLLARGHAIGEVDGMLGDMSRAAIKLEQQRLGWTADGRAGLKLLKALKTPG